MSRAAITPTDPPPWLPTAHPHPPAGDPVAPPSSSPPPSIGPPSAPPPSGRPPSLSGVQTPARQVPPVQGLPSSWVGFEQAPIVESHSPTSWHSSSAVQVTVDTGSPQAPLWHVSPLVQAFASSHAAPSGLSGLKHVPVPTSQVPGRWHWSSAKQSAFDAHGHVLAVGVQMPAWQLSPVVQARPSLQVVPSGLAGSEQMPVAGSQVPASWH
jgi:hypothetical protein